MVSRKGFTAGAALALITGMVLSSASPSQAEPTTRVLISSYIEGSSNNKALELHNPGEAEASLSGYTVTLYSNGATRPTSTLRLEGRTLAPGGHLVIAHSQADVDLASQADLTSPVVNFNGDDAVVLAHSETVVDSIGQVGFDPGIRWESDGVSTQDATLTKKACTADTDPSNAYDPSVDFAATPKNDFSRLRTFTCTAAPPAAPSPSPTTTSPAPEVAPIGAVQGSGEASPLTGQNVTVEGIVTGDFQTTGQFNGAYIQDRGDGDETTSDGIFVFDQGTNDLHVGDQVRVTGTVNEFNGQTQITPNSVTTLTKDADLPAAVSLTLPVADWERYEGMRLTFPQALTIVEYFNFDRFGEITYATKRQWTPTAVTTPGPAAAERLGANQAERLIVDDGRGSQNPSPAIHPNGHPMSQENYFRGGDTVANLTGVLSYHFGAFKLQPTQGGEYTAVNSRPSAPAQRGDMRLASFNVLNYFTTLTSENRAARGADTPEEFQRQQAKIVAAMTELDADVLGLMEIENNGTAVQNLVAALNEKSPDPYAAIDTGRVGSDAIFQAFIYKPSTVEPVGPFAVLDFGDKKNRPSLTQTFRHKATGALVTVSVNHLKSKGSACAGDPDLGDGQGNCNLTRTAAAERLAAWLDKDPTGQGAGRTIIIGDLNSYDHEDPITTLVRAGYADMERQFSGEQAYSYVFDGMAGYLDHALANEAAAAHVVDTQSWHINADEADIFDYDMSYKKPAEQALFSPDPYRSSDHDPVVVSLQFRQDPPLPEPTPSPAPTSTSSLAPTADPSSALDVVPGPAPTAASSPVSASGRPVAVSPRPGLPKTGGQDRARSA